MKICITGGSGILGTALRALPGEKVFVDRVERSPLLKDETYVQADIRDGEVMRQTMEGCQVLIHCAGSMGQQSNWDKSMTEIMCDNIDGLMTVFNVARDCGVERILFASSNHAVGMYEVDNAPAIYEFGHGISVDELVSARPDSFYGVSKVMGEAYGRFLAENGGPRCYSMRIGSVRSEAEDHPYAYAEWGVRKGKWPRGSREYATQENRLKALWMSRRDFIQMTNLLMAYDGPSYDVFNAVSDNDRKWLSIAKAKNELGYKPQDNSEGWVQIMTEWQRDDAGAPKLHLEEANLRLAVLIPVRVNEGDDLDFISELIKTTVASARECTLTDRIFLATDSEELAARAGQLGVEAPFLRERDFSSQDVRADRVLQDFLERLEKTESYLPDLVAPLEITHPFRPPMLIENLVTKLLQEHLNTVIAGYPEKRPVWMKRMDRMVRVDEYEKRKDMREPLHIGLASLGCVTYAEVLRKGSRFGSRIGVFEIDEPFSGIEIDDFTDSHTFRRVRKAFK